METSSDYSECLNNLYSEIHNGNICSYSKFTIKCNLFGYNENDVLYVLLKAHQTEEFAYHMMSVLVDYTGTDIELQEKIIEYFFRHDHIHPVTFNSNVAHVETIESLEYLKKFDINNPLVLIRYFLKFKKIKVDKLNFTYTNIFMNTLKMVIDRCDIRGRVNKRFLLFKEKLIEIYENTSKLGEYVF